MNEKSVSLSDGVVSFAGAVSVERRGGGFVPWRIDHQEAHLHEPGLCEKASWPAGVRLTFVSDARQVRLVVEQGACERETDGRFDLLVDGKLHGRVDNRGSGGEVLFTDIEAGEHVLELYLPQSPRVCVRGLRVDERAMVRRWVDERPRWVVYGSSITHCVEAAGPSETWPALVANRAGLNLTCLGFGGQCHLDVMVARMIRDMQADYISCCLGINVYGNGSLNARSLRPAVIGLIKTIRDGHATTPMAVVSPICSPEREGKRNEAGMTLAEVRATVHEAVGLLAADGDDRLWCVDGLELFGEADAGYLPDGLHPNAAGYRLLAERYERVVMGRLLAVAGAGG